MVHTAVYESYSKYHPHVASPFHRAELLSVPRAALRKADPTSPCPGERRPDTRPTDDVFAPRDVAQPPTSGDPSPVGLPRTLPGSAEGAEGARLPRAGRLEASVFLLVAMALLLSPVTDDSIFVPIVEQDRKRSRRREEAEGEPLLRQASTISKAGKRAMEQCAHADSVKGNVASAGSSEFWQARLLTTKSSSVKPSYEKWNNAVTTRLPQYGQNHFVSRGGGANGPTMTPSRASSRQMSSRPGSRYSTPLSEYSNPPTLHGTMSMPQFGRSAHFGPGAKHGGNIGGIAGMALDDDVETVASRLISMNGSGKDDRSSHQGHIYQSAVRAFRGPKVMFNQRTHGRFNRGNKHSSLLMLPLS